MFRRQAQGRNSVYERATFESEFIIAEEVQMEVSRKTGTGGNILGDSGKRGR